MAGNLQRNLTQFITFPRGVPHVDPYICMQASDDTRRIYGELFPTTYPPGYLGGPHMGHRQNAPPHTNLIVVRDLIN